MAWIPEGCAAEKVVEVAHPCVASHPFWALLALGSFLTTLKKNFFPLYVVTDEPKGLDNNEKVKTGIVRKTLCFSFVFAEH